jgi:NOL1/NOP2/fmu family ribosome biogenesis protein
MKFLKILNSRDKKEIFKRMKENYGVSEKLPGVFMQNNKDRIYYYSGSVDFLAEDNDRRLRIDKVGLYLASMTADSIRFTIEGSQIIGPMATKNVLEVSSKFAEEWVKGEDFVLTGDLLEKAKETGFYIIKSGKDYYGSGLVKEGKLTNYLSKNRRLKDVNS